MHLWTHTKPESLGQAGEFQSFYHDTMIDHDKNVGSILDELDRLGIAENTIVIYGTDNGPHMNTWPDAAMTPFRGEKNTNWEGGWRVPAFVRWPGRIKAGSVTNEVVHHMDWLPTFAAVAGDSGVKDRLLKGEKLGARSYKVHLDGYNILPLLTGETKISPRKEIFYFSDDGDLTALRYNDWKLVFMEQRAKGMMVWAEPFVELRLPKLFNLRRDPFERADESSNTYWDWYFDHVPAIYVGQALTAQQIQSFVEFPPRQKPASFNLDSVLAKMQEAADGGLH
jgi:arylsulfatase